MEERAAEKRRSVLCVCSVWLAGCEGGMGGGWKRRNHAMGIFLDMFLWPLLLL